MSVTARLLSWGRWHRPKDNVLHQCFRRSRLVADDPPRSRAEQAAGDVHLAEEDLAAAQADRLDRDAAGADALGRVGRLQRGDLVHPSGQRAARIAWLFGSGEASRRRGLVSSRDES